MIGWMDGDRAGLGRAFSLQFCCCDSRVVGFRIRSYTLLIVDYSDLTLHNRTIQVSHVALEEEGSTELRDFVIHSIYQLD